MQVYNWLNFIQHVLHPEHCPCCGSQTGNRQAFCKACRAALPFNDPACPRCALPLPPETPADTLCGRCSRRPPPYDRAFAALSYQAPVSQLISGLKFHRQLHLAAPLARLMIDRLGAIEPVPDLLMPVPLHPLRLRERGFNQSLELARILADPLLERFHLPPESNPDLLLCALYVRIFLSDGLGEAATAIQRPVPAEVASS